MVKKKRATKSENYILRHAAAERAKWEAQAAKDGRTLADWIRHTLNKASGK